MRPRRTLFLLCGALVASLVTALTGATVAVAPPAAAATLRGYDISWPQCPGGEPMPPTDTDFVVIGLTNGLAFTENPCVASLRQWSVDNAVPAHAYTMATYPTSAQLTQYAAAGPYGTASMAGKLRNVGYAEGRAAVATLRRIGWDPPMVWVDVEPRPKQPWPATTTRQATTRNRWVVEGIMRALSDSGFAYGVYSSPNAWTTVVGRWWLPGVPVWATVGPRGEAAALAACSTPSWSGGPVFLAQHWNDDYDFDVTCPPWSFEPATPPAPSASTADVTGDWRDDLVARETAAGRLWLYPGNGATTGVPFSARTVSGSSGWAGFTMVETPGDLDGDGRVDLIARDAAGALWLYPGRGGTWGTRRLIGTGWQAMRTIAGAGDLTGDGRPDVVARQLSNGTLYLYPGNGTGGFSARRTLATGWSGYDRVIGLGDVTANGVPDLLARQASTGRLYLFRGLDSGTLGTRALIGSGWNTMSLFAGAGDLTGDAIPDLVVRASSGGALYLYPGRTSGTFAPRRQIGSGWQVMNALA
jgi:hypothetical protein